MLKAKIKERLKTNGGDYFLLIDVDFEAQLIPEEIENNIHEDIEVIEVYDDFKIILEHETTGEEVFGGENLLNMLGLEIKDLLESHISEYYSKYKKQITDYI